MRTREEIEYEIDGNIKLCPSTKDVIAVITYTQMEILLDIRDLLANPPVVDEAVEISGMQETMDALDTLPRTVEELMTELRYLASPDAERLSDMERTTQFILSFNRLDKAMATRDASIRADEREKFKEVASGDGTAEQLLLKIWKFLTPKDNITK